MVVTVRRWTFSVRFCNLSVNLRETLRRQQLHFVVKESSVMKNILTAITTAICLFSRNVMSQMGKYDFSFTALLIISNKITTSKIYPACRLIMVLLCMPDTLK